MKRFLFTLVALCLTVFANAKVIAIVGDYEITSQDLNDKISQMGDKYDYAQAKQVAFSSIFADYLFLNYADENEIKVSETELDNYFITQLGDAPSLQTKNNFDYNKYLALKNTEKGQNILKMMRRDILIKKSKELVKENFDLDDNQMLKQFVLNQLNVDIKYAILDADALDIPNGCNTFEARTFFKNHRYLFVTPAKTKFRFKMEYFKDYADSAKAMSQRDYELINDSLYTNVQMDSLKNEIYSNYLDSLTYAEIAKDYKLFRSNKDDSLKFWESYDVDNKTKFDDFPKKVIKKIVKMKSKEVSLPFKTKNAYVVVKSEDPVLPKEKDFSEAATEIWKNYVTNCNLKKKNINEFFEKNIDKFMVSASIIEKISVKKSVNKEKFYDYFDNNKSAKRTVIFLDKYKNKIPMDNSIADKINSNEIEGIIKIGENYILYRELTRFPEYIPDFEDIKAQLPEMNNESLVDTALVRAYYDEHKKNLVAPDSIKLGYAYFPLIPDTLTVADEDIKYYYQDNKGKFKRSDATIKIDYIALPDSITALNIEKYLNRGDNFIRLRDVFSITCEIPHNAELVISSLDDTIKKTLNNTPMKGYSAPFAYKGKWIVLYKKAYYFPGQKKFSYVKKDIENTLKMEKAKEIAYQSAKTFFDSTRYFSESSKFTNQNNIIKMKLQDINLPFEKLGDITPYKEELRQIRRFGSKLTSIVQADSGYAVVFLLRRKNYGNLNFEDVKKRIAKILFEEKRFDKAKQIAKEIRKKITEGTNPDSILFFHGGWKEANRLKLDTKIKGIDKNMSNLLVLDISKHSAGYYSPILKLDMNHLLFYHIIRMKNISKKDFYAQKGKIKRDLINGKMKQWLADYRKTLKIKIFGM